MGQKRKVSNTQPTPTTNQPPENKIQDKSLPFQEPDVKPESQACSVKPRELQANVTSPRRSTRRQNVFVPPPAAEGDDDEIQRIVREVTLTDSEDDDDAKLPDSDSNLENLHEKIDRLITIVEELHGQTKSSTSTNARNENSGSEISYKSLYIDAKKKIKILVDEQYELTLKLERTLGKLEVCRHVAILRMEKHVQQGVRLLLHVKVSNANGERTLRPCLDPINGMSMLYDYCEEPLQFVVKVMRLWEELIKEGKGMRPRYQNWST
ncbi:hypothetical protein ACFE04_028473 [Oxalis oulophora]